MSTTDRIVVAGASLGGLRTAEQLRRAGFVGEIVVVGDEPHMPYNRPPLSKEVLAGKAGFASLAFRPKAAVADVVWRLGAGPGSGVVAADLAGRTVRLGDGESLAYDGLVVATGLRPRRLDVPGPAGGRYTVRTLDDARALQGALRPGARVVVVGAGFIGCEVAATARGLGAEVTVVEPEPLPLVRALGELLARALLARHRAEGVRFALGRTVSRFVGTEERVGGVVLDDGTRVAADVVVEAVGSLPNVEWLAGNGLDLRDGVLCDARLRVVGAPEGVVAVGDVAQFPHPRYDGVARRVEHWSVPGDSAKHAAKVLVGEGREAFAPLPSFWSDQYAYRIQSFGAPGLGVADVRVLDGDPVGDPDGDVLVGYHDRGGRLVGVAALGGAGVVARAATYRAELTSDTSATQGALT
ncbi:FAD-dependent oxidoreductase [Streptomyces sp. NBC_00237]|uniref:NAD(P)/FAD-dependent oxidoreductase n=1 Tax=Streptomyces sp. NBC_00237 TaxID=2975687 RepID=UPI002255B66B|nr:FAD-dependent oxidoreductase [Streptomyces sp. NBC_00237]MCX5203455.1 FAD-dependent oxidoreductase [Streptomyces sp. NBC_00237]